MMIVKFKCNPNIKGMESAMVIETSWVNNDIVVNPNGLVKILKSNIPIGKNAKLICEPVQIANDKYESAIYQIRLKLLYSFYMNELIDYSNHNSSDNEPNSIFNKININFSNFKLDANNNLIAKSKIDNRDIVVISIDTLCTNELFSNIDARLNKIVPDSKKSTDSKSENNRVYLNSHEIYNMYLKILTESGLYKLHISDKNSRILDTLALMSMVTQLLIANNSIICNKLNNSENLKLDFVSSLYYVLAISDFASCKNSFKLASKCTNLSDLINLVASGLFEENLILEITTTKSVKDCIMSSMKNLYNMLNTILDTE